MEWPTFCPGCEMFLPDCWAALKHAHQDHPRIYAALFDPESPDKDVPSKALWQRERPEAAQ